MDLFKFTGAYENVSVSFKWDPYCMAGLFVNDLRVVASLRLKQLQMELHLRTVIAPL